MCASTSCSVAARADSGARIRWKPVDFAQLKLDGKAPLAWGVYQSDKKKQSNLILVLLGKRYLALDTSAKLVYLVLPAEIHSAGKNLDSDSVTKSSRLIPSSDWSMRDIGPAESIRLTLGDYGQALDVQLPHPINFRPGIY